MNAQAQAHYRTILEGLAGDLRRRLAESADSSAPVSPDRAIGRLTRQEALQAQQMALAVRRRAQQQLQRVEHALELLGQGRYGRCARCGQDIGKERLDVAPDTFLCVSCIDGLRRST
ncbi:MAG TPA: TraR/DksA C4-type zinc finger protein [Methylomirabilota bacterium]